MDIKYTTDIDSDEPVNIDELNFDQLNDFHVFLKAHFRACQNIFEIIKQNQQVMMECYLKKIMFVENKLNSMNNKIND